MSDRIVKHSSRYKGPAGDSRPAAEIFAGIEARAQQAQEYQNKLLNVINDITDNAKLLSWEGRCDLVRDTVVDWLIKNHPNFGKWEAQQC